MKAEKNIDVSGPGIELKDSIEERVSAFEQKHEADLLKGGSGWVPRVRSFDYVIAIVINAALTLWLAVTLIWD